MKFLVVVMIENVYENHVIKYIAISSNSGR